MQVRQACNRLAAFAGATDRRQQESHQEPDDADDDQQLHERECVANRNAMGGAMVIHEFLCRRQCTFPPHAETEMIPRQWRWRQAALRHGLAGC